MSYGRFEMLLFKFEIGMGWRVEGEGTRFLEDFLVRFWASYGYFWRTCEVSWLLLFGIWALLRRVLGEFTMDFWLLSETLEFAFVVA